MTMTRSETLATGALAATAVGAMIWLVPQVDNGDPTRGATGMHVQNSCDGTGGDTLVSGDGDLEPLGCNTTRYYQGAVSANTQFVVEVNGRDTTCYQAGDRVELNPDGHFPGGPPTVRMWTVDGC